MDTIMGVIMVLFIAIGTLGSLLEVVCYAWILRKQPRPYPMDWCTTYMKRVARSRHSLFMSLLIVAVYAVAFLIPVLSRVGDVRLAAFFGGIDLISAVVLYALWKWAGHLISTAAMHNEYAYTVSKS
jgi:hypothetical protein